MELKLSLYLRWAAHCWFDISPCQNMGQGCFMVKTTCMQIKLKCGKYKNSWPNRYPLFGTPQASSNILSPASKQKPGGGPPEAKFTWRNITTQHECQVANPETCSLLACNGQVFTISDCCFYSWEELCIYWARMCLTLDKKIPFNCMYKWNKSLYH